MPPPAPADTRFARPAAVDGVEARCSRYAARAFARHTHPAYAVAAVTRGATDLTLYPAGGEERLRVAAGDIVLLNPGQAHACNPLEGSEFAYYMLYVDPACVERLFREHAEACPAGLAFRRPLLAGSDVRALHAELCTQAALICRRDPRFDPAAFTDLLANLLFPWLDAAGPDAEPAGAGAARLEDSRLRLLARLADETPLAELAGVAGLSPYAYVRAFHRRYGLPPIAYKLQQRVDLAKRLLREGRPPAAVAAEAGFADQSHFTRKFRALVGATPGRYQREIRRAPGG